MKTFKAFLFSLLFLSFSIAAVAQTKTGKLAVAGECGMCKSTIEKAAKSAGASFAAWDADSKILTVKYEATAVNTAKIEKAVAAAGYDTKSVKATDEAYNKLHGCCKYDRTASLAKADTCCDHAACTTAVCMKDGQCQTDAACCKEAGCDKKDCCKKS